MSDLMFEWFEIDPDISLGGAIARFYKFTVKNLKISMFPL